ncbi:hypothetical protein O0I10_001558 [Lichtheimia ornata]|uniref:Uncharacterized protein n=1 Tax=Lichtheimia ornata TaxID=688661 RepID=A0AAD7VCG6_9FUNG|nr:uncharacterized protein O0I10_001558 [Lichtheimia ornata]KAJ8662596.1 hypothetical protein O0I10_001558 [Lichtheimia ornata]
MPHLTAPTMIPNHARLLSFGKVFHTMLVMFKLAKKSFMKTKQQKMQLSAYVKNASLFGPMESDSAVFDIAQSSGISTSEFFGALTRQHPKALGWVPSKFRSSCVIVSFEDASSGFSMC